MEYRSEFMSACAAGHRVKAGPFRFQADYYLPQAFHVSIISSRKCCNAQLFLEIPQNILDRGLQLLPLP